MCGAADVSGSPLLGVHVDGTSSSADVVKPSISPPEMAKYVTRSDGESRGATPRHSSSPVGQAEGEGGVIDV